MSSDVQVLLTEQYGSLGKVKFYALQEGHPEIVRLGSQTSLASAFWTSFKDFVREVFLPHGYPDSVSDDYFEYQVWDTVQAFASTVTGTFTTRAVLKGVGVGDAQATPLAAAITWILKDGTGMIGRIVFAWWKGSALDGDCKKWRLFADLLNDIAMFFELLLPHFRVGSLYLLCTTTTMKSVVGVAGGATRASITQHQAKKGNMADVSAKDSSQETCVNLVASLFGIVLLAICPEGEYEWFIFIFFTCVHLFANYSAVTSLVFSNLNNARLVMLLRTYLMFDSVPSPQKINYKESVVLGFGPTIKELCSFNIKVGVSLKEVPSFLKVSELQMLTELYKHRKYLILPDLENHIVYVALDKDEDVRTVLSAYFHAVLLTIGICNYNRIDINVHAKRQLHHITPVVRLRSILKSFPRSESLLVENLPASLMRVFNDFVTQETSMFFTALRINNWNIDTHSLEVGQWRCNWQYVKEEAGLMNDPGSTSTLLMKSPLKKTL